MAKKVFVSYSRDDDRPVQDLVGALALHGYEIWVDKTGLRLGERWWDGILRSIQEADVVLAVISPSWTESAACKAEWRYARQVNRTVLGLTCELDDSDLPAEVAGYQVGRITDIGRIKTAIDAAQPRPLPTPLPPRSPAPISGQAVEAAVRSVDPLDLDTRMSVAFLGERARSADVSQRERAGQLAAAFLDREDLFEVAPTDLLPQDTTESPGPWRASGLLVVGSVLAGLALTHLFWATGLYELFDRRLGRAHGVLTFSGTAVVVGFVMCGIAVQHRVRAAKLGLGLCLAGVLAVVLDSIKIGWPIPW
jgi:hypothetical protein